jgi:hypothetical protein
MNAKRCTDSRKISVRQEFVIALGKDYPNAAQTITCERRHLLARCRRCRLFTFPDFGARVNGAFT